MKNIKRFLERIAFSVVSLLSIVPIVWAQSDWSAEYIVSDSLESDTSLRILLPEHVSEDILPWLAIELNNIDVTEIASLHESSAGFVIALDPPRMLNSGAHVLRLVQYRDDGSFIERGNWQIGADRNLALQSEIQRFLGTTTYIDGSYLLSDGTNSNDDRKIHGTGASNISYSSQGDNWAVENSIDLVYDSNGVDVTSVTQDDLSLNTDTRQGREVDLGEYLLSAKSSKLSALVGHHSLSSNGLLIQDFHRRGVSINAQSESKRLVGSGFAYRTEPVSGFRYGSGISNNRHRVAGTILSVSPLANNTDALTISSTYLRAKGEDSSGTGISGSGNQSEGDGGSISINSSTLDGRLNLRTEHAKTDFDLDGDDTVFSRSNDKATIFQGLFHIWQNKETETGYSSLSVGLEKKEIGLAFRSLANPSQPRDIAVEKFYSVLQINGFALQFEFLEEHDNVDDDLSLPTLTSEIATLQLSWTPQQRVDESGEFITPRFGLPSIYVSVQYNDQLHTNVSADFLDLAADRQSNNYQGGISFQHQNWYWGLNHAYSLEKDYGSFASRIRNKLTDISFQRQYGETVHLGFQTQYNSALDRNTAEVNRSKLAALEGRFALLDQKLVSSVNYSVSRDTDNNNSIDAKTTTYGLRVDWLVRTAKDNKPSLSVWMQGERQRYTDQVNEENNLDPYQVFLGIRMDWQANRQFGGGN